jgi:hypothetical protein
MLGRLYVFDLDTEKWSDEIDAVAHNCAAAHGGKVGNRMVVFTLTKSDL